MKKTQLWFAALPSDNAVFLGLEMGGFIPTVVKFWTGRTYHTVELEQEVQIQILERYFSIALRVPQQGSSSVSYLITVEC